MLPRTRESLRTPVVIAGVATFFSLAYSVLDRDPPLVTHLFITWGPLLAVTSWVARDVRGTWLAGLHDWAFLNGVGWPVFLPWYAFHHYRPVAWALTLMLIGLIVLPQVTVLAIGALWVVGVFRRGRLTGA